MITSFLIKGFVIGFSIAAPVGPIGVLCIRRTLSSGSLVGFASGLGAASADAVYGSIAGFGIAIISNLLISQFTWLRLAGGLFLCWLGLKTFLARPAEKTVSAGWKSLPGAYASTFFLTLTNPMTIISFAGIFAGLGLGDTAGDNFSAAMLVVGVFLGSAFWWLLLSGGVGILRHGFTHRWLQWVNRLSGIILIGFGLVALLSLLYDNVR